MKKLFPVIIALITGLTLLAGSSATLAASAKPPASKHKSWKKPHGKKNKG
jgi:hypothetical protein